MKKDAASRELDLLHKQLLFSLRLPDAVLDPAAPPFVKSLDLAFARNLLGDEHPWGSEDVFEESSQLVRDVIAASAEGRQLYLASEVDLLRKVKETGKEQIHRGPFDITEGVYPISLRGYVVHLVRTGKYRVKPFSSEDIKEMSFLAGVPAKKVEAAAAALPVYEPAHVEQVHANARRLRDALAAALEQHLRAAELTHQNLDSERGQSMGTMCQGMAQHINNILSIILGYSSLVADKAKLEGDLADALKKVTEAAQRGRRFTEEILSIVGDNDEEEAPTSVHERINGVLTLLQNRTSGKIKVETDLKAKRDVVTGPPGLVHQIIFNLVTNALESLSAGGSLTISTANGRDETDGRDLLQLEVTDSVMNRKAMIRKTSGTSSGKAPITPKLTSVFGLVGRLEGTVNVTSDADSATHVVVTMPATAKPAARPEKKVRRRLAPSNIWVADDDAVVREMCRRVLSEDGHTVAEASSCKEMSDMLRGEGNARPDLIVYDFNMPDCSGLEFVTDLREQGIRVPVLMLSGFKPDQADIGNALKLRKTFFLQKPFSFRDMSDMVTVALGETLIGE